MEHQVLNNRIEKDKSISLKRLVLLLILGLAGAYVVRTHGYEGIYIASNSMAPTLEEDLHVFVNKWAIKFRGVKRGDIVMFTTPQEPDKGLVKRVIAIGGDTIAIKVKFVYLNGVLIDEPYVQYLRPNDLLRGDMISPILIPKGYVFVMGDNRDYSEDSRDWKDSDGKWSPYVPLSSIKGLITPP